MLPQVFQVTGLAVTQDLGSVSERNFAFMRFLGCSKIECMMRSLPLLAAFLTAHLLAFPRAIPSATTCVEMPPLKPLHRVWGVVFFPSGDRAANARVSVLHGGREIAVQNTDDHGRFAFDQLKPGKYELHILVEGVPGIATAKVVLTHPNTKSRQEIAVSISLTVANCSGFSLVETKSFEARLKPTDDE